MQGVKVHTVCPCCFKDVVLGSRSPGRYVATCSHCSRPYLYTFPENPQSPIQTTPLGPDMGTYDLPTSSGVRLGAASTTSSRMKIESSDELNLELSSDSENAMPVRPEKPPTQFRTRKKDTKAVATPWANLGELIDQHETGDAGQTDLNQYEDNAKRNLNALIHARQDDEKTAFNESSNQIDQDEDDSDINKIGGYEIINQIGKGGMGSVYLARQMTLNREVALKLIHPKWSGRPRLLARFVREAYAVAQLTHPNVIPIYDIGEDQDQYFYAMEYVRGQSLKQLVELRQGGLPIEEAASYILQAARGLNYVHKRGMIHRDIKPENLLLTEDGLIKIADLGLVKFTDHEMLYDQPEAFVQTTAEETPSQITLVEEAMGTPGYMAPEQCYDAASVDYRADIYALGCTFFALIAAQTPPNSYKRDDSDWLDSLLDHHQHFGRLIDQKIPEPVSKLISNMTAFDPDNRVQTMSEVIDALERFVSPQGRKQLAINENYGLEIAALVDQFNHVDAKEGKRIVVPSFYGVCLGLSAILQFTVDMPKAALLVAILLLQTAGLHAFLSLLSQRYLMCKVKQYVKSYTKQKLMLGSVTGITGLSLALYGILSVMVWSGQMKHFMVMLPVSICISLLFTKVMERFVRIEQDRVISDVRSLLRKIRQSVCNEKVIREFLCEASGKNWEPIYESLFGYEDKMAARKKFGKDEAGIAKPRWHAWRDPIIHRINQRINQRKQDLERVNLAQIERKALEANGMSAVESMRRAADIADTMMTGATLYKATGHMPAKMRELVSGEDLQLTLSPSISVIQSNAQVAPNTSSNSSLNNQAASIDAQQQTRMPTQMDPTQWPQQLNQDNAQDLLQDISIAGGTQPPSLEQIQMAAMSFANQPKPKKKLDYTRTTEGLARRLQRIDHLSEHNTEEDWGGLSYLLGPTGRLVIGALLVMGGLLWGYQNASTIFELNFNQTMGMRLPSFLTGGDEIAQMNRISDRLFNSINFGLLGALFVASAFWQRRKLSSVSWIVLPVMLFGPGLLIDMVPVMPKVLVDMIILCVCGALVIWRLVKVEPIKNLDLMEEPQLPIIHLNQEEGHVPRAASHSPQMKKPVAMHFNKSV